MNYADRSFDVGRKHPTIMTSLLVKVSERMKGIEPMILVWWCLALSIFSSTAARYTDESLGLTYYALVAMGAGGCAWFWLLSRTLFRTKPDLHPGVLAWLAAVIVIEAMAELLFHVRTAGFMAEVVRVFGNAASVICIASIVFVCHEVLHGYGKIRSATERRFRLIFLTGFTLMVAIAVLWVLGADANTLAAQWQAALLTSCAVMGLVGSRVAVQYRLKALQKQSAPSSAAQRTTTNESARLTQKILRGINDDALLTTPNLKVSLFADQIGEQEYKVTRCITNHLQYRNFNHFLNSHRIDRAKHLLHDPHSHHRTIAAIAFDCGFNSLGPFNRAFKQHTGMTPREFRRQ